MLFCHEVWKYDDVNHIQKLAGFESICGLCHSIKHLGLAGIMAKRGGIDYSQLVVHYCRVNGCTKEDFEADRSEAFELWHRRSQYDWTVDISYLDTLGFNSDAKVARWMREHPDEVEEIRERRLA
jgi:hypothetical protein